MTRIGIIICDRYRGCGGGKCFRSVRERLGAFARYPAEEQVEVAGFTSCGGCPGGTVEDVPDEFKRNGVNVVHLATGLVVGYPPCPYIRHFKSYIETKFNLPVVVGTHPIPLKYLLTHRQLQFWEESGMKDLAGELMNEARETMEAYN